jgi:flagellar protein FlaI
MAHIEKKPGNRKEVKEHTDKSDAEFTIPKKTKFGKKIAGKYKQHVEIKNITDVDAEKMVSSMPSENSATLPEGEAPIIKETSETSQTSELASKISTEAVAEKFSEHLPETPAESESERTPESVPEKSIEISSERTPESVTDKSTETPSERTPESVTEKSTETPSERTPESIPEKSTEIPSETILEPLPEKFTEILSEESSEPLLEKSNETSSEISPEPESEISLEATSEGLTLIQKREKISKGEKEQIPGSKIKGKKGKLPMKKDEKALSSEMKRKEDIDDFMQRFEGDKTRDLISEKMTLEKHAAYDIFQEKLVSDIETRIKKLKEMQGQEINQPQTIVDKIKLFITKEQEEKETYDPAFHGPLISFEGLSGCTELERYWVNEPYALVVILFNPEKNSNLYYVVEPKLSEFEKLFLDEIKDRLKDVLLFEDIKSEEDKDKTLTAKVRKLVRDYAIDVTPIITEKILYYTRRDFIKFGKIDALMHDDRIEDVSANGFDIPIYLYHKKYTNLATNVVFTENELDSYVIRLAQRCGKHISVAEPMIDATMPDGSRIQMTLGTAVTTHGATFTIRKFSEVPITPIDLISWHTFSAEEMAYLWLCIENNKSLIYAGGTASGKTSSLNAVSLFIPWQAKIITLEDTRELKLPHPNWIPGVTRDSFSPDGKGSIDMYDLLKAALRQRPEFLLVGEVRGKEALTLFQAMSTGHTTFSTMHADSVSSAIHRLENPPISVPRTMIQALNIISIQSQTFVKGKRARRNMKLVEITDIDPTTRNIKTNDIFVWDALTDKFNRVGESKALAEITLRRGWSVADLKKELMNRQKVLEFMVNNKIFDFNAIATIIHDYQVTPDKVLKKLMITG